MRTSSAAVFCVCVCGEQTGVAHPSDDPAQAHFEGQRFGLLLLSRRCREGENTFRAEDGNTTGNVCSTHDSGGALGRPPRATFRGAHSRRTCGNIGVEDGSVLQGAGVPAAHVVPFLWKVLLVSFLQHRLEVLGWTLRTG